MRLPFSIRPFLIGAGIVAIVAPLGVSAFGRPSFPGGLGSSHRASDTGFTQQLSQTSVVGGRELALTSLASDPEQTLIAYRFKGLPEDGDFVTIAPRPRLVLDDGSFIPFIGNFQHGPEKGTGTLVFAGVPEGSHTGTLQVDGAVFRTQTVSKQFSVKFAIDNRAAYAASRTTNFNTTSSTGPSSITVTSVSETPSVIVVRGAFPGLTTSQIQAVGRPLISLQTSTGAVLQFETGRMGFGDGLQQFEFRFASDGGTPEALAFAGFDGTDDAALRAFDEPVSVALR